MTNTHRPRARVRRFAALATAGALSLGGIALASPAIAAEGDPHAALTVASSFSPAAFHVGEQIMFTTTATNAGNVDLDEMSLLFPSGVTVESCSEIPGASPSFGGNPVNAVSFAGVIAPGAAFTCVSTYTPTDADVTAGQIKRGFQVNGRTTAPNGVGGVTKPPSPQYQEVVVLPAAPEPSIDVSKNVEGDDSQNVEAGVHDVTVRVVNNGDEPLTDFVFTDLTESGNDVLWSTADLQSLSEITLQPGEEFIVHGTVLVETENHRDSATVDATGEISGQPVTDEDPTELVPNEPEPDPVPEIDISKNAEGDDKYTVEPGTHPVTVTIVNTGEDALTDFTFQDTTESGNNVTWTQSDLDALAALTLQPGEQFVVNGTVLVEDGTHRDEVLVDASGVISGLPVTDDDPTELVPEEPVVPVPNIDISKNVEGDDSQTVPAGEHEVTVRIVNKGEEPLTDFVFNDTTESGADVTWNQDDLSALADLTLAPGAEFIVRGTVLVEDETHRDSVTVDATGTISGVPVDDEDPTELVPEEPVVPVPNIDISKNAEGDDKHTVEAGEHPVTVTIVNTGEEALTDFVFDDTTESGNNVTWSEADLAALDELTLEPGASFVVNGTVLVEEGTHRDNVVVDASGVISGLPVDDEDPTELVPEEKPEVPTPGIDVSKNAEGDDSQVVKPGEHEVTVTIVNNGAEALTDFTFTDTTESGHDVVWSEEDLKTLETLSLEPGDEFVVHGTVLVESGAHRDEVAINATGVISGLPVDDADPTEFVPEKPTTTVPVKEDPKPEALATTGGEIAPWVIGGGATALALGGVLLLLARRKASLAHQE